jgi:hypothetical protein
MVCGLFPLSVSFGLGEVEDGEMPMLKISLPLPEFHVARLVEETNDQFWVRVELAIVNVVGMYAHGMHEACIVMVPSMGRLNRVFEQGGVPYGPRLVPGSQASKEATEKRKNDSSVGPARKHVKLSSRKAMAPKVPTAPKGTGAASSKTALAKAAHKKSMPKAGAPQKTIVLENTVAVPMPKVGVIRINTGMKRQSAASSQVLKEKIGES